MLSTLNKHQLFQEQRQKLCNTMS